MTWPLGYSRQLSRLCPQSHIQDWDPPTPCPLPGHLVNLVNLQPAGLGPSGRGQKVLRAGDWGPLPCLLALSPH